MCIQEYLESVQGTACEDKSGPFQERLFEIIALLLLISLPASPHEPAVKCLWLSGKWKTQWSQSLSALCHRTLSLLNLPSATSLLQEQTRRAPPGNARQPEQASAEGTDGSGSERSALALAPVISPVMCQQGGVNHEPLFSEETLPSALMMCFGTRASEQTQRTPLCCPRGPDQSPSNAVSERLEQMNRLLDVFRSFAAWDAA